MIQHDDGFLLPIFLEIQRAQIEELLMTEFGRMGRNKGRDKTANYTFRKNLPGKWCIIELISSNIELEAVRGLASVHIF